MYSPVAITLCSPSAPKTYSAGSTNGLSVLAVGVLVLLIVPGVTVDPVTDELLQHKSDVPLIFVNGTVDGLNDDVDVFQNQVKELKQDNKWLANRNKEIIKKKDDEINELKRKINYLNDDIDCLIEDKKEANKESERLREIIEM